MLCNNNTGNYEVVFDVIGSCDNALVVSHSDCVRFVVLERFAGVYFRVDCFRLI